MRPPGPPLPPADVALRTPKMHVVPRGRRLHRFFTKRFDPLHFERSSAGRFSARPAPNGPRYGVIYVAERIEGAFAETFLRTPGRTFIPTDLLAGKAYAKLVAKRALALICLRGPALARIGATAEICHRGQPYDAPQAWSEALYDHPVGADGIAYTSRHDDQKVCLALFDRSAGALREAERRDDLDQDWSWRLAEPYGVGLPPSGLL